MLISVSFHQLAESFGRSLDCFGFDVLTINSLLVITHKVQGKMTDRTCIFHLLDFSRP